LNTCITTNAICFQALSVVGETIEEKARITKNTAPSADLNTQFFFEIGNFTAVSMCLASFLGVN